MRTARNICHLLIVSLVILQSTVLTRVLGTGCTSAAFFCNLGGNIVATRGKHEMQEVHLQSTCGHFE